MKLLILEDEESIRKIFTYMLHGSTYEVVFAETLREANRSIAEMGECGLFVADYKLPDGFSLDVIRKFREKFPKAGIIVISGSIDIDNHLNAIKDLGIAAIILKPFDPDQTFRLMESAFDLGRKDKPREV